MNRIGFLLLIRSFGAMGIGGSQMFPFVSPGSPCILIPVYAYALILLGIPVYLFLYKEGRVFMAPPWVVTQGSNSW